MSTSLLIWLEINIPFFILFIVIIVKPDLGIKYRKKNIKKWYGTTIEEMFTEKGVEVYEQRRFERNTFNRIGAISCLCLLIALNAIQIPRMIREAKEAKIASVLWVNVYPENYMNTVLWADEEYIDNIRRLDEELKELEYSRENECEHEPALELVFDNGDTYYVKTDCGGICIEKKGFMWQAQMTDEIEDLLEEFEVL